MALQPFRLLWLDLIRVVAAQLIVLHHLAFYGPIAERIGREMPGLIDWLSDYARVAVQVFLVISGFLAARALHRYRALDALGVWSAIVRRYVRLFIPFVFALLIASLASIPARLWIGEGDWISAKPDALSILAHLTGLFDYLAIEALTVGAWYVTIDFQLHLLLLLSLWGCQRLARTEEGARRLWWAFVLGLAIESFFILSRNSQWDVTPFYFFGSFALGLAAERLSRRQEEVCPFERAVALVILGAASLSCAIDPAVRPAVALASAVLIAALARGLGASLQLQLERLPGGERMSRVLALSGRSAYSLFLIHFPLAILLNAIFGYLFGDSLHAAAVLAVLAWLGAMPFAWWMYRWVERPVIERAGPA